MSDDDTPVANDDGETPGLFQTFIGGGFGTVQIERAVGTDPAPPAVSGRRYLRAPRSIAERIAVTSNGSQRGRDNISSRFWAVVSRTRPAKDLSGRMASPDGR